MSGLTIKVGIVGSRNFSSNEHYELMKYQFEQNFSDREVSVIVSGGAPGADRLAERLAKEKGIPTIIHKADWATYGISAGPLRNNLIVRDVNIILAFPSKDSRGTWDTIRKAGENGVTVIIYEGWDSEDKISALISSHLNKDESKKEYTYYSLDEQGYVMIEFPVVMQGQVRVGRIDYSSGKPVYPTYPGFTPIVVMTQSSEYGSLGPYVLKNERGQILENVWQFSKVYHEIPRTVQRYSRWDHTIIWDYPAETHITDGKLNKSYWVWREKGMASEYPIRYPVGKKHMKNCMYAIKENGGKKLDYIEARKEIYVPIYLTAVQKEEQYFELVRRMNEGENLLIIEVDGPHEEHSFYYKTNYSVENEFIMNNTMLATPKNLKIMLEDQVHPFGHGYCLAMALLNMTVEDLDKYKLDMRMN